jgi:hypothetical protein
MEFEIFCQGCINTIFFFLLSLLNHAMRRVLLCNMFTIWKKHSCLFVYFSAYAICYVNMQFMFRNFF